MEPTHRTGEAHDFLAAVLEHLDEGLHVEDEQGCLSFVNPAGASLLGYGSDDELHGHPAHQTIHYKRPDGSSFPAEECPHRAVFETGRAIRGEDWFVRKDGSMLPVAYSAAPVPLPGGRGVVVAYRDISDRRREEEERECERELMDTVLDSLDTGVVACDADGVLSLFNRATREMHGVDEEGLTPEEWAGRYDLLKPDGRTPMGVDEIPLFRALRGERLRDAELVIAPKGRPRRTVLCSGQAMQSSDGRPLGAVVAMQDVTERRRVEQQLAHQALHDPLTGLANRQLLLDRLEQGLARRSRRGGMTGLLLLNLDNFKAINDAHGYDVGDEVLVTVGKRLRDALRAEDTIARGSAHDTVPAPNTVGRIGGDEFVLLLEDLEEPADGAGVAERILSKLRAPLVLGTHEILLDASVGITLAGAGTGRTPTEVLRDGGTAMHAAKQAGKGRYELFDAEMRAEVLARTDLIRGLRRAVEEGQLCLLYQPQVDLSSGRMTGVEALVRWKHPDRGLLSPDEFIPTAESTGMVVAIDDWVLREACTQLQAWDCAGLAPLHMAVNVSARRLVTGDLAASVEAVLSETGISAKRLELELTETVAVEHDAQAVVAITRVRGLGVQVAIDDFGMGHSALSRLQTFPVDRLKIDRSFVASLTYGAERGSITDAMIAIAQSLGLEVVAEGVETHEHLRALRSLGCPLAQGYLFSRPVPAREIEQLIRAELVLAPLDGGPESPAAEEVEASTRERERLTRNLLAELQRLTGLETTYLTRIDWGQALQEVTHARNTGTIDIPEGLTVDWSNTVCRQALEKGVNYTDDVPTIFPESQAGEELGLQTYLSVPLVNSIGDIEGTLCGASTKRVQLGPEAVQVMERCARILTQGIAAQPASED